MWQQPGSGDPVFAEHLCKSSPFHLIIAEILWMYPKPPSQHFIHYGTDRVHDAEMKNKEIERTGGTEGNEGLRVLSHSVGMLTADW